MSTLVATSPPTPPHRKNELAALRAINYDWTMHLRSVWTDPRFDSPQIQTHLRQEFQDRLDEFKASEQMDSPLGWLVIGAAGSGKTHWLSICRRQAIDRQIGFVLVDMTGVVSFWDTVLQGFLDSLEQEIEEGKSQQEILTERFLETVNHRTSVASNLKKLHDFPPDQLAQNIDKVLEVIYRKHRDSLSYHDVIRAILAMVSKEVNIKAAGLSWLSGNPVDDEYRALLGFQRQKETPRKIVEALSWMMHLCGPTVLAFDQLDPIVAQLDPAAQADGREPTIEGLRALSIIRDIANGLGDMYNTTLRTLTIASCLEATIDALRRHTLRTWEARFQEARILYATNSVDAVAGMLYPRVLDGCNRANFKPPSPVWPLSPAMLPELVGLSPREVLKTCQAHRENCLRDGIVYELTTLSDIKSKRMAPIAVDKTLDVEFECQRQTANVRWLLEQSTEDERISPIIVAGCRTLLREQLLPETMDCAVDDFPGGKTTKPLHARIRLVDHAANDREMHFCFRALERKNAVAFQARLKGFMNGSGIDDRLQFRNAVILRTQPFPGGPITEQLRSQYKDNGGKWHKPSDDEIRTLFALEQMLNANPPGLDDWLKARKPASHLPLFALHCAELLNPPDSGHELSSGPVLPQSPGPTSSGVNGANQSKSNDKKVSPTKPAKAEPHSAPTHIPLGQRKIGNNAELVQLPLQLLEKHTVILAGAGAGKTVLLKRIIEEAALAGVPSIVIDGANDLASLGEPWPEPPTGWLPGDAEKSRLYHRNTDVTYWTPGRQDGNHLVFEPLPDLGAVAAEPQELQLMIDAAMDALAAMVISGKSAADNKRGILTKALKFFAEQGGGNLRDFIALLCELPPEARLGINKEGNMAKEMADILTAKLETNPMLRGVGTGLDPAILFGDAKKTAKAPRISVISLIGLASADLRQQFVYQLGMALFSWVKKNPHPPGRGLRGLLIVDEAKDFVPSVKSLPSKASLQLLASQARKYHLGLVLATQNPKEIENKVIGNCSTQFYGKASAPNSQQVIREQLQVRGGSGNDIGALKAGQFYASNSEAAGLSPPIKLCVPLCLSRHRTLDESEIIQLAAKSRQRLG